MEQHEETPNNKNLNELPYSELKKIAKKHGIKGNMKAEKIIAAINLLNSSATESFSTPIQKEINSSKKNKEAMFDVDQATPLSTPKRGTYSLETSSFLEADEISVVAANTSLLDMSNVTMSRGSERKLRSRKVSFMSPVLAPSSPKNSNLRLRPKTPIASRASVGKRVSFSTPASKHKKSSEKVFPTTPLPKLSFSEENSGFRTRASGKGIPTPLPCIEETSRKNENMEANEDTANVASESLPKKDEPSSVKSATFKKCMSTEKKQAVTPGSTKTLVLKNETASKLKRAVASSSTKTLPLKSDTASKLKRGETPNFKKIHEKMFEKMESIGDYQKRKLLNTPKAIGLRSETKNKVTKAKSKIPCFGGIPFVPSLSSTKLIGPLQNDKKTKLVSNSESVKSKENTLKRSKSKFDLKASLSRKLGYKPYKGPVKPLAESNLSISTAASVDNVQERVNKVVAAKRKETRSVIRGVRTNKRFELQMKNRKLD